MRVNINAYGDHWCAYRFTHHEFRMGGLDEIRSWLEYVEHDIRHHWERLRQAHIQPESYYLDEAAGIDTTVWANFELERPRSAPLPDAYHRAQVLFISAAGDKAFRTLDAGKPLPILGSQGTKYLLHKRASYCIERPSDGARLCAVVPGVPLWDHLLGIKLMVENDEPQFLRTANVSGGYSSVLRPERLFTITHE